MKKFALFAFVIIAIATVTSCTKKETEIVFDKSEPLSLAPDVEWAVITEPYVTFHTETAWDSSTNGHCRKGDIFQVKAKTTAQNELWYKFDDGWVHSSSATIYSNRYKAATASEQLKK